MVRIVIENGKTLSLQKIPYVTVGNTSECNYVTDGIADQADIKKAMVDVSNDNGEVRLINNLTYNLNDEIPIIGTNYAWQDSIHQLRIRGSGYSTIINQTAANKNIFTIKNRAVVDMRNFKTVVPDANSGYAFQGMDDGADWKECIINSYIGEIICKGGDATHPSMFLQNPYFSDFGWLDIQNTHSDGIVIDSTNTAINDGNCHFRHLEIIPADATKYALVIQSITNAARMNLLTFDKIDINGVGGGIKLATANNGKVTSNTFNGLDLEATENQIFFNAENGTNAQIGGNTFNADFMANLAGKISINLTPNGSGHMGNIFNIKVASNGTDLLVSDGNNSFSTPNEYNFVSPTGQIYDTQFSFNSAPTYRPKITWQSTNAGWDYNKNPNSGLTAGNIADGGTITHHVGATPNIYHVYTTLAGEYARVTAASATTLTVAIKTFAGAAGTAQPLIWDAGWFS